MRRTSGQTEKRLSGPSEGPTVRRAVSTGSSLLFALVVMTAMSGGLGAPRTLGLAAATIGQTACSLQVSFRALASRESRSGEVRSGLSVGSVRPVPAIASARLGAPAHDGAIGFVRLSGDLPPPALA